MNTLENRVLTFDVTVGMKVEAPDNQFKFIYSLFMITDAKLYLTGS